MVQQQQQKSAEQPRYTGQVRRLCTISHLRHYLFIYLVQDHIYMVSFYFRIDFTTQDPDNTHRNTVYMMMYT